ncbi:hypothetical protein Taro_040201 [Colocasia esculenta]|uniref:Uncharacterized protein n=1 Tax=Colocasia esculenta TaxID=4460 RepID=A0A843WIF5_COLES|nr:hypothetical protein [Colocasia esculenta]
MMPFFACVDFMLVRSLLARRCRLYFLFTQGLCNLCILSTAGRAPFLSLVSSMADECQGTANKHTIILMQSSPNRATRTFMDYDSIGQAMDGKTVPKMYYFNIKFESDQIVPLRFKHLAMD